MHFLPQQSHHCSLVPELAHIRLAQAVLSAQGIQDGVSHLIVTCSTPTNQSRPLGCASFGYHIEKVSFYYSSPQGEADLQHSLPS